MLYRVFKHAFDRSFLDRIEKAAAPLKTMPGRTDEHDEYATRQCDLRWISQKNPMFATLERLILDVLEREKVIDTRLCVIEDMQYTSYGSGGFHSWHIDAYRRVYNQYDMGPRFIGKKRKISISILLNDSDEFSGGTFEISMFPNGRNTVGTKISEFSKAGDMVLFESSVCHRVAPVESGQRKSLVCWVCA